MDTQKLMMYAIIALVGLYFLRETCGLKLPFIDNTEGFVLSDVPVIGGLFESDSNVANANVANANVQPTAPAPVAGQVKASEELGDETFLRVNGINRSPTSCYPQNTLKPVADYDNANPTGEGILKGVNFLDAGFHVGVNTVGQSLRNANRQIRSEPPNPQVSVSPWLNTTIGPDLGRKALEDEDVCVKNQPGPNGALASIGQSA